MKVHLETCDCGRKPKIVAVQVAEDLMETWAECACGLRGEEVEDAYSDSLTAAHCWNEGNRRPSPHQPEGGDNGRG